MTYEQLKALIEGQGSRFVTVEFLKKDGSLRTMLVQSAATKYRVLGEAAAESAQRAAQTRRERYPNLLNIYDVDRDAIRSINLDTVLTIVSGATLYQRPEHEVKEIFA